MAGYVFWLTTEIGISKHRIWQMILWHSDLVRVTKVLSIFPTKSKIYQETMLKIHTIDTKQYCVKRDNIISNESC